jgi:hypothetical protein
LPKAPFAQFSPIKTRSGEIGSDVAAVLSRQIVHPMKSVLGVVLNGFWAVSPNNQALAEAVTGALTNIVRSLLEYVLNGVFCSVEIRETYQDGSLAPEVGGGWEGAETYGVNGQRQPLRYRVYRRSGLLDGVPTETFAGLVSGPVLGLLQDYAAYRDAVREYRGFGAAQEVDQVDHLSTKFDARQGAITVTVVSDWSTLDVPSIPVLRAYCNGVPTVLTCVDAHGTRRQYQGRIDRVAANAPVWVLSNYGGFYYSGMDAK